MPSTSCIKRSENSLFILPPNSFAPRILILESTSHLLENLSTAFTKNTSKMHNSIKNQVLGSVLVFFSFLTSDPGAIDITSLYFGLCHFTRFWIMPLLHIYTYIALIFARVNINEQSKNSTQCCPFCQMSKKKDSKTD